MRRLPYVRHVHGTPAQDIPALECRDVSVRYPGAQRLAVSNVSLRVPNGARLALIGANGSGKSTLLKAIAGVLPVAGGSILLHGARPGGCCHRVAYLAQRPPIDWRFPMTVRKLVLTGRYVHLGWFARPRQADYAIVERVMDMLQIRDLADEPIGQLSGGQQQRTLLARAMAQEAGTLLLDEPLTAVDAQTRQIMRDLLQSLWQVGKTIVVATHDVQEIDVDFDMAVKLEGGCRVESDVAPETTGVIA